jgi:hypothetical protein
MCFKLSMMCAVSFGRRRGALQTQVIRSEGSNGSAFGHFRSLWYDGGIVEDNSEEHFVVLNCVRGDFLTFRQESLQVLWDRRQHHPIDNFPWSYIGSSIRVFELLPCNIMVEGVSASNCNSRRTAPTRHSQFLRNISLTTPIEGHARLRLPHPMKLRGRRCSRSRSRHGAI